MNRNGRSHRYNLRPRVHQPANNNGQNQPQDQHDQRNRRLRRQRRSPSPFENIIPRARARIVQILDDDDEIEYGYQYINDAFDGDLAEIFDSDVNDSDSSDNDTNDEEDDEEDYDGFPDYVEPYAPFLIPGDMYHFQDIFRRITYGLNSSRTGIRLDTLPAPRPLDVDKLDLFDGNLPPHGSIPIHRSYLIPPFTNCIVDSLPEEPVRRHIFLTNYSRDCWNGLQDKDKQEELRRTDSRLYCTTVTHRLLRKFYPLLFLQIQDLVTPLDINKTHQILGDCARDIITVYPFPSDSYDGSCVYLLVKEGTHLLHTGSSCAMDEVAALARTVSRLCSRIDFLYIDTALYFPSYRESFKQNIGNRPLSFLVCKSFIMSQIFKEGSSRFVSMRFYTGMEAFMLWLIEEATNFQIGITKDLYEMFYERLHLHTDKLHLVEHLDSRFLNQKTARVFFYSRLHSDFDHIHSYDENHIRLEVIYDYHSSIEQVDGYDDSSVIFQKHPLFISPDSDTSDSQQTFYGILPCHLNTTQVKNVIDLLKPERIFGLSRAPGVGYTELKEDFRKQCDRFSNITKTCT